MAYLYCWIRIPIPIQITTWLRADLLLGSETGCPCIARDRYMTQLRGAAVPLGSESRIVLRRSLRSNKTHRTDL